MLSIRYLGLLLLGALISPSALAQTGRGVTCVWDTIPAAAKTTLLTATAHEPADKAEYAVALRAIMPAAAACSKGGHWQARHTDLGVSYAFAQANILNGSSALARLGIDSNAVIALYSKLDAAKLLVMQRVGQLTDVEESELVDYLSEFLTNNGPATEVPARGIAGSLLIHYAQTLDLQAQFKALT